ncbi:DEKNAAC100829 [Brettanomyces naardenensis]|uniref:DEKNAAC100829 n=1 Tax=Brettanomyces naardenensis TaxID=13370 RepID=A0A448YER3_BRENA|nr:DEKNAAC100829 [Brettanomyces naardenensis]
MSANFEVADISLKDRKTSEVLYDHYWGLWYFLFPFYMLTKTENTVLYIIIMGILSLIAVGVLRIVFPLVVGAGSLLTSYGPHITQKITA